ARRQAYLHAKVGSGDRHVDLRRLPDSHDDSDRPFPEPSGHDSERDLPSGGRDDDRGGERGHLRRQKRKRHHRRMMTSATASATVAAVSASRAASSGPMRSAGSSDRVVPSLRVTVPATLVTRRRTSRTCVERRRWARLRPKAKTAAAPDVASTVPAVAKYAVPR